ncbi:hypothetical protein GCM10023321_73430 [Pseudonocardia eucalypti]|uniref:Uncharacterized protein n=1 Tax=Pseudonocardia eucalypti TaxID=648755 RepID=A0ABP9R8U8_9PSEU
MRRSSPGNPSVLSLNSGFGGSTRCSAPAACWLAPAALSPRAEASINGESTNASAANTIATAPAARPIARPGGDRDRRSSGAALVGPAPESRDTSHHGGTTIAVPTARTPSPSVSSSVPTVTMARTSRCSGPYTPFARSDGPARPSATEMAVQIPMTAVLTTIRTFTVCKAAGWCGLMAARPMPRYTPTTAVTVRLTTVVTTLRGGSVRPLSARSPSRCFRPGSTAAASHAARPTAAVTSNPCWTTEAAVDPPANA